MTEKKTAKKKTAKKKTAKKKAAKKKAASTDAAPPKSSLIGGDLAEVVGWLKANSSKGGALLGAASELLVENPTLKTIVTGDPVADRALLDAAAVAQVAGRWRVSPAKVIEALGVVLQLGLALA